MRLYEAMMTDCTMMDLVTEADGMGGFSKVWKAGAKFRAAITNKSSSLQTIADAIREQETFTVLVPKGTPIALNDVFRRDSDGQLFKATSSIKDAETPDMASFQFGQISAERWKDD